MPLMIRCMAKSVQQNGVYVIGMKYTLYCSVAILYNIRQYTVYRIAQNVGGGKHWRIWRIEVRFAKVLCRQHFPTATTHFYLISKVGYSPVFFANVIFR